MKKWCTRFQIFMDSLKIPGFTESWFPKISWDFLFFLYNVTNIQNKMETFFKRFNEIYSHSVWDSEFVADPSEVPHMLYKVLESVPTLSCRYLTHLLYIHNLASFLFCCHWVCLLIVNVWLACSFHSLVSILQFSIHLITLLCLPSVLWLYAYA